MLLNAGKVRRMVPAAWRLRHEIAAALAVKALALTALYFLFFASHPAMPEIARRLFDVGGGP